MPAPEKERDDDGRSGDHRGVFAEKIQGEFHRAVFDVVTAGKFLLRFRQIEGQSICLGENCDHKHEKGNDHGNCEQPFPRVRPVADKGCDEPAVVDLVTHHAGQAQVSDNEKNRDYREPERKLVRKHLRAGTDAAKEWIFGV